MPEVPDAAVKAAAEVMLRQYESEYSAAHLTWRDFADPAREILGAVAPAMADHVARKILAHMEEHGPRDGLGNPLESMTGRAWRRYLAIAAQAASLAFSTPEDIRREAAEALNRGDYTACYLDDAGNPVTGTRED